jgi:hypothetical protein
VRMSAIPASSITSTEPVIGVSHPSATGRAASAACDWRYRLRGGLDAARADGAAPITVVLDASWMARMASNVNVLPVPAGPTSTRTAAVGRRVFERRRLGRHRRWGARRGSLDRFERHRRSRLWVESVR